MSASYLSPTKLEIHYWLNDEAHIMDAFVQNKCEHEFLCTVKEIASSLGFDVIVDTEPITDGGIRRWFQLVAKEEGKTAAIKIAVVTALVTGIFVTPLTTSISKVTEKLIEEVFKDKELRELEKEKLKLEIEKLRQETQQKAPEISTNPVIKKRKSNFYEALTKDVRINQISYTIVDEQKEPISDQNSVPRNEFNNYLLVTDDIEPMEVEEAIIELVAPVLKKGNYKWIGLYNGEPLHFNMKSSEFKTMVQTKQIEFMNGFSINCFLSIRRKVTNEGIIKNVGYDIIRVNHYFINENPVETPEGKRYRKLKEAEKQQLKLFPNPTNE